MNSLPRCAIALGLALSCAGFLPAARSHTQTQKKTLTGSVSGRVTIHGKGAAGIFVVVRKVENFPDSTPAPKAVTDQDGNYRIYDLPSGNYQISLMAPAYVSSDSPWPGLRGKAVLLAEGEDVQGIDFSVVRGGVIMGKVTDSDGRPLIEERLMVVPENQARQEGQRLPTINPGLFQTDDRGIYRIYGIAPGRYKVYVGVSDEGLPSNVRFGRVSYMRTFHPSATEPDEAEVVEVTEGSETTNINITVGRGLPGFSARGRVVDGETGQPVQGLRLGLRRVVNDRDIGIMNAFTASNSQGEFLLENVTPGKYSVFVATQPGSEARVETTRFEVIDQDVTGLLLKTFKGLTITGVVTLDGSHDKSVFEKLSQLRLLAYVNSANNISNSWQESTIGPDGSFRLGGLGPGRVSFSLHEQNRRPPVAFSIARVERNGVAGPRNIEIKADEETTGIKVVVRYGTGSIRGEVKMDNGPLPPGARVTVWIKKSGDTESTFRPHNLDARGHFLIEGIAAGNYDLNANAQIPGVRPVPATKQPVVVSEGTVTDVVVILDLKPEPEPSPTP